MDLRGTSVKYCCYSEFEKLKAYYEIINEARPLSGFFPTNADYLKIKSFIIMKLSNLPSFRAIRALFASQLTFEK